MGLISPQIDKMSSTLLMASEDRKQCSFLTLPNCRCAGHLSCHCCVDIRYVGKKADDESMARTLYRSRDWILREANAKDRRNHSGRQPLVTKQKTNDLSIPDKALKTRPCEPHPDFRASDFCKVLFMFFFRSSAPRGVQREAFLSKFNKHAILFSHRTSKHCHSY